MTAKVSNGIATVDFTANPIQVVGTSQTLAIAQVVFTATQQPGVTGVLFQIGGQPIEVPTASGATVPGPVDRTVLPAAGPGVLSRRRPGRQAAGPTAQATRGASAHRCSRS